MVNPMVGRRLLEWKGFSDRNTPVLDFLKGRKTIVLDKPIVSRFRAQTYLPPGITHEEALTVIQEAWGKKLASGIADKAQMTGAARDQFVENWSRVVSEGMLK